MLHVGGPLATCLFEGEGDVVAEADVAAVVEAAGGAGGAMAGLLFLGWWMMQSGEEGDGWSYEWEGGG